jgi:hypothetical protein
MKVRLPALFQDTEQPTFKGGEALAQAIQLEDTYFLDGPISRRVAVLDFDPDTGVLLPGAKLRPADGHKIREYDISGHDYMAPEFREVMVFGTVTRTIEMFEHRQILGREVTWAFDGPQLLVVPRAGRWRNAFYERDSHSLQFFFFEHAGAEIYTSLSEDIVAHETGHAILDGIAPDLYNAITPQSLAIHESVADLVALTRSMQNDQLRDQVLRDPEWRITQTNQFTALAEEFGKALSEGRTYYLRNAYNDRSLGGDNAVAGDEPHELAEVLTGALYAVLVSDYEQLERHSIDGGMEEIPARGKALGTAARRFERFVFRALDYLPPGDVSFADFVRAVLSADAAAYREASHEPYREVLRGQALTRQIVLDPEELSVDVDFEDPAISDPALSFESLLASDWYAYEFVTAHRDLFGIPEDLPFEVRDRKSVTREFGRSGDDDVVDELILKVSWEATEPNDLGAAFPQRRDVTMGTTFVVDRDTRRIRARLTTDSHPRHVAERDGFLRRLVEDDLLIPHPEAGLGARRGKVGARVLGDRMKVTGAARTLHVTGDLAEG